MPTDFRLFQDLMEAEFGERFNRLFRGPAWSGCEKQDEKNPLKARINVACLGHQAISKDFSTKFNLTTTPEIQVASMQRLKEAIPDGRFWIKLDGTDIKKALQESVEGVWNGDADLQNGKLQVLRTEYDDRIAKAKATTPDNTIFENFEKDKTFLKDILNTTVKKYQTKFKNDKSSTEKLKELNWEIVELVDLLEQNDKFLAAYNDGSITAQGHSKLRADMLTYLRNLFKKKRAPAATHVLVIMLSDERRARKPYAMPIQFVPYHSITAADIQRLTKAVKEKMVELGMKCCGTVTDGEFKKLRYEGVGDRPIHIYKIIQESRKSVCNLSEPMLLKLITKTGETVDGQPLVEGEDSCIPNDVINKFHELQEAGKTLKERLTIIKDDLIEEDGVEQLPWHPHRTSESNLDMLRTIVASYTFRSRVAQLKVSHNVDFTTNFCEPEVDPTTGEPLFHIADHNHLTKRIGFHTRDGGPEWVDLRRFEEAVRDKTTDLNLPALLGTNKQSTVDAEKLLSHAVADFFERKGYTQEARYARTVARWHEATDGRGMSQEERKAANLDMRNMILDEWMPWHRTNPDLSKIDINRRLKGICGFSQETVIELTANIDCQERRRKETEELGYAEHPRAGTTDDVECFFALLHRITHGQHVTLGEFRSWWLKLVIQFSFRMDNDLPFYVHTLNERYSLEEQPSFDEPQQRPRLHCLTRRSREDSSIICGGRAMLPARYASSIRHMFHRVDHGLIDVPGNLEERIRAIRDNRSDVD
ncbi:uncharacterized protein [Amphiura filiformis]|uniref:uncharacterized protein n=1 Tax=Amphiura filiformis TaxID=82378 RepID=UPI003B21429C